MSALPSDHSCCYISLFLFFASVRVSNELGAGHPKAAKFSVLVVVVMSVIIQSIIVGILLITRKDLPAIFTESKLVMEEVSRVAFFLSGTIFLSSIQPVLSGRES